MWTRVCVFEWGRVYMGVCVYVCQWGRVYVGVSACVDFVMCGCFSNMYTVP